MKPDLKDITLFQGRIGINTHDDQGRLTDAEFDAIAAFARWLRLNLNWEWAEASPGVYDWTVFDYYVSHCRARGIVPVLILCYTNVLAYGPAAPDPANRLFVTSKDGIETEAQLAAFLSYVRALVTHLKGGPAAYEVWNEPHGSGAWYPRPNMAAYARLCKETTLAVRDIDPDAYVFAMGGIGMVEAETWVMDPASTPPLRPATEGDVSRDQWRGYYRQLLAAGVDREADAVSVHIYNSYLPPEAAAYAARYCRGLTSTPIVSTEGGYPQSISPSAVSGYNNLLGAGYAPSISERDRALFDLRKLLTEIAEGVSVSILFTFRQLEENPMLTPARWGRRELEFWGAYTNAAIESTYGWTSFASKGYDPPIDYYVADIPIVTGGNGYPRPVPHSDYGPDAVPAQGWGWKPEIATLGGKPKSASFAVHGTAPSAAYFPSPSYDASAAILGLNGVDSGCRVYVPTLEEYQDIFHLAPDTDGQWAVLKPSLTMQGDHCGGVRLQFTGASSVTSRAIVPVDLMTCADPEFAKGVVVGAIGSAIRISQTPGSVHGLNLAPSYWCVTALDDHGGVDECSSGSGIGYAVGDELADSGITAQAYLSHGSGCVAVVKAVNAIGGVTGGPSPAITDGGAGYEVGDILLFTAVTGTGVHACAKALSVSALGSVTSLGWIVGGLFLSAPRTMDVTRTNVPDFSDPSNVTSYTMLIAGAPEAISPATPVEIILNNSHCSVKHPGAGYVVPPSISSSWTSVNEVWGIWADSIPADGELTVTIDGTPTAALPRTATAAALRSALSAAIGIPEESVHVVGGPLSEGSPFSVQFVAQERQTAVASSVTAAGTLGMLGIVHAGIAQQGASSDYFCYLYGGARPESLAFQSEVSAGALTSVGIYPNASSAQGGHYFHKIPSTHVVYGPESIEAYALFRGGRCVDTVIYNCGVGLDPGASGAPIALACEHQKDRARVLIGCGPSYLYLKRAQKGGAAFGNARYRLYHVGKAGGGTFTLTANGASTGPIPYAGSTAATIESALRALAGFADTTVTSTGAGQLADTLPVPMDIEFKGAKARTDVTLTADGSSLTFAGGVSMPYAGTVLPTVYEASAYGPDAYVQAATNEQQTLAASASPDDWTGGTLSLSWTGSDGVKHVTPAIPYNASASAIESALSAEAPGAFTVSKSGLGADALNDPDSVFTVTFVGYPCFATNVGPITADMSDVTSGGTPTLTVTETRAGGAVAGSFSIGASDVGTWGELRQVTLKGISTGTLPDGLYVWSLDVPYPNQKAQFALHLLPKPRPAQEFDVLSAFRSIGTLMDGFHYVTDVDGRPVNLSEQEGSFHLRLLSPATSREARIIWCAMSKPCRARAICELCPTCDDSTPCLDDTLLYEGAVTGIAIEDPGDGYPPVQDIETNAYPRVIISGGGGSGAAAKAIQFNGSTISAIQVLAKGQDYTSIPSVTVDSFVPATIELPSHAAAYNWRGAPITLQSPYTPTEDPVFLIL